MSNILSVISPVLLLTLIVLKCVINVVAVKFSVLSDMPIKGPQKQQNKNQTKKTKKTLVIDNSVYRNVTLDIPGNWALCYINMIIK